MTTAKNAPAANQIAKTVVTLSVLAGGGEPAGNPPAQDVVVDATTQENPPQVNPADEEAAYPDDPKMKQLLTELKGVDEAIEANNDLLADTSRPNKADLSPIAKEVVKPPLTVEKFLLLPNAVEKLAAVWRKRITDALKILEGNRAGIIAKMKARISQKKTEDELALAKAEKEALARLGSFLGEEEPSIPVAAPASPEAVSHVKGKKLSPKLHPGEKLEVPSATTSSSQQASVVVNPREMADLQRKFNDFIRLNGNAVNALPEALKQANFYLGHEGFTPLEIALSLRLFCISEKSKVLQLAKQARAEGYPSYADIISDRFLRPLDKVITAVNTIIEKVFDLTHETFQIQGGREAIQARLKANLETHLAPRGGGEYVEGLLLRDKQGLWETLFPEFEDYAAAKKKIDLERKTVESAQKKAADDQRTKKLNRRLDLVKAELLKLLNDQEKVDDILSKITNSDLEGENFVPAVVALRLAGMETSRVNTNKKDPLQTGKDALAAEVRKILASIHGINIKYWEDAACSGLTEKDAHQSMSAKDIILLAIETLPRNVSADITNEACLIDEALNPSQKNADHRKTMSGKKM